MRNIKPINIKNRTYYFFNAMINITRFGSTRLQDSVHPLYLFNGKIDVFIKERKGNKYLVFDSTNKKNMQIFGMGFKMRLKQ